MKGPKPSCVRWRVLVRTVFALAAAYSLALWARPSLQWPAFETLQQAEAVSHSELESPLLSAPMSDSELATPLQAAPLAELESGAALQPAPMADSGLESGAALQSALMADSALESGAALQAAMHMSGTCEHAYGAVELVVVADDLSQLRYDSNLQSVDCYAQLHGYMLGVLDPAEFPECSTAGDLYFQRLCLIKQHMRQTSAAWVVLLDGDVAVLNFRKCIEDYIKPNKQLHLLLRYKLDEITALYIMRVGAWADNFLTDWANSVNSGYSGVCQCVRACCAVLVAVDGWKYA